MKDKVNARLNRRFFAKLIKSCVFVSILILICTMLNYVYVLPDYDYRAILHNLYNMEEIDCIYLGSSHVQVGINPAILDGLNGEGGGGKFQSGNIRTKNERLLFFVEGSGPKE
ncbi:MAG: hypothetical protein ACI4E5_12100 [Suilimivivens sp.]